MYLNIISVNKCNIPYIQDRPQSYINGTRSLVEIFGIPFSPGNSKFQCTMYLDNIFKGQNYTNYLLSTNYLLTILFDKNSILAYLP